jgi:hypothetical protein
MAAIQGKHSPSRAHGSRGSAHAPTKPVPIKSVITKTHPSSRKHRKPERLPPSLRFTETKRGKTTIRRYRGRTFYRFKEFNGKTVDFLEVFTAGEYHAIDARFQDKTALHFIIDPGFTLQTEHAD